MKGLNELSVSETFGYGEIGRIAEVLRIPNDVTEEACKLFSKAKENNLLHGRRIDKIAGACLYIACREFEIPWMIKDIGKKSTVSTRDIGKAFNMLFKELEIKLPAADPSIFIDRFCFDLNLSDKAKSKAEKILETAKEAAEPKLTDGKAGAIAAAIVYIAALLNHEHRTQNEISKITGITEITIRTRYKEIAKKLGIDVLL